MIIKAAAITENRGRTQDSTTAIAPIGSPIKEAASGIVKEMAGLSRTSFQSSSACKMIANTPNAIPAM
jgi:hypothetical protein